MLAITAAVDDGLVGLIPLAVVLAHTAGSRHSCSCAIRAASSGPADWEIAGDAASESSEGRAAAS